MTYPIRVVPLRSPLDFPLLPSNQESSVKLQTAIARASVALLDFKKAFIEMLLAAIITLAPLVFGYQFGSYDHPIVYQDDNAYFKGSGHSHGQFAHEIKGDGCNKVPSRLAWLEYLANIYHQCDDFTHARNTIKEMNRFLGHLPTLNQELSTAVQLIQDRMERRQECLMKQVKEGECKSFGLDADESRIDGDNWYGEVTAAATLNLGPVMETSTTGHMTLAEEAKLEQVHFYLLKGNYTAAKKCFQELPKANAFKGSLGDPYGRTFFVMRLAEFDMRYPDNCMPLWRDECCLNWKMKLLILNAHEQIMESAYRPYRHIEAFLGQLIHIPSQKETQARVLIASARPEAFMALRLLTGADRYLAEACLTLKNVPNLIAYNPNEPHLSARESKLKAREIYLTCSRDPSVDRKRGILCREGKRIIDLVDQNCPKDGIVRVGLFPMVFNQDLFLLCPKGRETLTDRLEVLRRAAPSKRVIRERRSKIIKDEAVNRPSVPNGAKRRPRLISWSHNYRPFASPIIPPTQLIPVRVRAPHLLSMQSVPSPLIQHPSQGEYPRAGPSTSGDHDGRLYDFMDQLRDPTNAPVTKSQAVSNHKQINQYRDSTRSSVLVSNLQGI